MLRGNPGAQTGRRPRRLAAAIGLLLFFAFVLAGMDQRLLVRRYSIFTGGKLESPLRLALVTDLHSCLYGDDMSGLLAALADEKPDAVLLGGDILDDVQDNTNSWIFLEAVATAWPAYYVTGNHEFWSGEAEAWKEEIAALGITVLEGGNERLEFDGGSLRLLGVDDPDGGYDVFTGQLMDTAEAARLAPEFTVLLSHRPEFADRYANRYDLVLSGHAHGGQWRIPGVLNGVFSPGQGFFPRYAGGLYELGETRLIVSRGLARESTRLPRFWNRPELVMVELTP